MNRNILLTPGPVTTSKTVKSALVVPDICPREKEFGDLFESVRTDLLKIVSGEEDYTTVLFACSGTGAVEAVLTSVIPKSKAVLIINNGAYGLRMQQICDAFEIEHIDYNLDWGSPISLEKVENILEKNLNKISHLAFVHHETTVGILNPLEAISKIGEKYKVEIIADAISSFAGVPINLKKDPIHYLISSSNKCLHGMAGIGLVICQTKALEKTKDYKVLNFYFNLYSNYVFQEKKKQHQFTPPVQIIYALRTAIDEYTTERYAHYKTLYQVMLEGMKELGFLPLVAPEHHSKMITAFFEPDLKGFGFEKMHDFLLEHGITIYPGKVDQKNTFRIANIGELTLEDIHFFLEKTRNYMHSIK